MPLGRNFCDACRPYVVECDACHKPFHERFIHEHVSAYVYGILWVCPACLSRLRFEEAANKKPRARADLVPYRIAAFDKALHGKNRYTIDEFGRLLHNLDPNAIWRFIKEMRMDDIIKYDANDVFVEFDNPSKPEIDVLKRKFGNWLRFGRITPPDLDNE